jgi:hypothetical protein
MSQTFNYAQDFLDSGGYQLGYSEYDLPDLDDMKGVLQHNVKVWEYRGFSERKYYGG